MIRASSFHSRGSFKWDINEGGWAVVDIPLAVIVLSLTEKEFGAAFIWQE